MSDLPKCKLCGHDPAYLQTGDAVWCDNVECILCVGRAMTQAKWRALMAPPVVTDAMVGRAADIYVGEAAAPVGERVARAVLKAALKE